MAIWLCRAGNYGQLENDFIAFNKIYSTRGNIDFNMKELSRADWSEYLNKVQSSASLQTISSNISQYEIFAKRMNIGDWVVTPSKFSTSIHVGVITSDYIYDKMESLDHCHFRSVNWFRANIERDNFPKNIQFTLGAFRTICGIKQETEFKEIVLSIINET